MPDPTPTDHTPRFNVKPEIKDEYLAAFARNSDPYSRRCFTFAEGWAERMEAIMAESPGRDPAVVIQTYAKSCAREENTDGITGFMYGMAVQILADTWVHGPALLAWHNDALQINGEGDEATAQGQALNPALLTVAGEAGD